MKRSALCGLLSLFMFASYKQFLFHPNEVRADEKARNSYNIDRIAKLDTAPAFTFIVLGDTQRFYQDLEDFINLVDLNKLTSRK